MKRIFAITVALIIVLGMCVCAVVSATEPTEAPTEEVTEVQTEPQSEEFTEAPTEDQAEPQTEAAAENYTEVPTEAEAVEIVEQATEPTAEVYTETVEAKRFTGKPPKLPTEEPTEDPTEEPYIGYDPDQDTGVGAYNPYMYCRITPVSNHRIGLAYIADGWYMCDSMGHCWAFDNPEYLSGYVGIVYDTCGTDDIADDVLVLIMDDQPVWIEGAICSD